LTKVVVIYWEGLLSVEALLFVCGEHGSLRIEPSGAASLHGGAGIARARERGKASPTAAALLPYGAKPLCGTSG